MTDPKDIAAARERLEAASRVHESGVKVRTTDLRLLLSAGAEALAAFDRQVAGHRLTASQLSAAEASLAQAREQLAEVAEIVGVVATVAVSTLFSKQQLAKARELHAKLTGEKT